MAGSDFPDEKCLLDFSSGSGEEDVPDKRDIDSVDSNPNLDFILPEPDTHYAQNSDGSDIDVPASISQPLLRPTISTRPTESIITTSCSSSPSVTFSRHSTSTSSANIQLPIVENTKQKTVESVSSGASGRRNTTFQGPQSRP